MRCISLSLLAIGIITTTSANLVVSDGRVGGIIHNPSHRIDNRNVKIDHLALHAAVRRFNVEQLQNLTSTLPVLIPRQAAAAANLQVFASALGGATAPAITNSGDPDRPFAVEGDTFPDFETASNRACDNQKNACAKVANEGSQRDGELTVGECDRQMEQCKSAALSAANRSFDGAAGDEQQQQQPPPQQGGGGDDGGGEQRQDPNQGQDQGQEDQAPPESVLVSSDENFDFFCDV